MIIMTDKDQAAYQITRITCGHDVIPWDRIPAISIDQVLWLPDAGIRAEGQLCYDDSALFVPGAEIPCQVQVQAQALRGRCCRAPIITLVKSMGWSLKPSTENSETTCK